MQSQPIRQTPPPPRPPSPQQQQQQQHEGQTPFKCSVDEDCNLNGLCDSGSGACACDNQWDGADCGALALLPADPNGGYQRKGYSQWGGNPFFSEVDGKYHVFTVEMTHGCNIDQYITNSQIVHAESSTPGTVAPAYCCCAAAAPACSSTCILLLRPRRAGAPALLLLRAQRAVAPALPRVHHCGFAFQPLPHQYPRACANLPDLARGRCSLTRVFNVDDAPRCTIVHHCAPL